MEVIPEIVNEIEGRRNSTMVKILAAIGLIVIGAIVIPALVGLIAAGPDIQRYLRMRRM
jgi:hypothetical protein